MVSVSTKLTNSRLLSVTSLISLVGLAGCVLITSPARNISSIVVFFVFLFVFLLSAGCLIRLRLGPVSSASFYKIAVVAGAVVLLVMFHGAQSLSFVDLLITVLIIIGLSFYINRRS